MHVATSFSDATYKGGGNLLIEDAEGCTSTTFLEDGFFDFLNTVMYGNMIIIYYHVKMYQHGQKMTIMYQHICLIRQFFLL